MNYSPLPNNAPHTPGPTTELPTTQTTFTPVKAPVPGPSQPLHRPDHKPGETR